MTVQDNVKFGLEMRRVPKRERARLAAEALTLVGLEGFGNRRVHELSGGQRQRVALARAIVIGPAVLLLDEPLGALDVKIRRQMQAELHALQRSLAATFIHVTHDQEEAMSIADTIVLLNRGRVEDIGPPERVYRRPASLFAATFMGDTESLRGRRSPRWRMARRPSKRLSATCWRDGSGTVGAKVRLSVRPECIRLGNTNTGSGVSLGRARLHDFVFQGTHRRCQASIADGRELVLRLAADNMVTPETTVDLWVQSRDVVLINREDV